MGARLGDSTLYGHLWATLELREVFEERRRIAAWLEILVALARAQAELGIVPERAAEAIAREADVGRLDLELVAAETRRTGHSTLGLIRGLREVLPPDAAEWVYFGATVQDVTDTWTALAMRRVAAVAWRDLRAVEEACLGLAERHATTLMAGRTHGQAGAPITFGLKAAGWADEARRHLDRLREGAPRWLVGQLGGAVGTMGFFGERGPELRRRFCELLDLGDPGISWTAARDRVAEFGGVMAMIAGTLGRIGNEVAQLQRTEIAEVREPTSEDTVGSITMPHKRNPEASEHLVTLARLVRSHAAVLVEGMVVEHERDGRAWKGEWVAFPEVCLLTGTALAMAREMLGGLEVDEEAMARNLGPYAASEVVLAALARALGKHRAQELLQRVLASARATGASLEEALGADDDVAPHVTDDVLRGAKETVTGSAEAMVRATVVRVRKARSGEDDRWP